MILGTILAGTVASAEDIKLQTAGVPAGKLDQSLANELKVAISRGVSWLAQQQKPDGSWSLSDFPAITALALQAVARANDPDRSNVLAKAKSFILSCAREDGGIYKDLPGRKGGGLSNYNTAICMTALHSLNDPQCVPTIQKARKFIAGAQHFGQDDYRGGFGYDKDTNRAYTDLLNTYYAADAMTVTAAVEDSRPAGEKRVDIDWSQTVEYVLRVQNQTNAGPADAGGLYYKPGESKAGTITNESGQVIFRSYGSITYAGMLALIYADVSKKDSRVRSAFDWAARHWSLEENPGMGRRGMYFFYQVLTKCLDAYGMDLIQPPTATDPINWRPLVARKLIEMQSIEPNSGNGFWINKDKGDYMENDPVLVTAYALLTLEMLAN